MAIWVFYSHYMLTPFMECLWYVKFWHLCFKQDQLIEWMTKGQAKALSINVLWYKGFLFRQQSSIFWGKTRPYIQRYWVLQQAGRLVDKIWLDFEILKILYRSNYLDVYFVYSSAMLLIVLEVHFSLLFSNKTYFRVCFMVCKIRSPFFMLIPTVRY